MTESAQFLETTWVCYYPCSGYPLEAMIRYSGSQQGIKLIGQENDKAKSGLISLYDFILHQRHIDLS